MKEVMFARLPRALMLTSTIISLALVSTACGGSSESDPEYVGFEIYGGQYRIETVAEYEESFESACNMILDTRDLDDPAWIEKFGLRAMAINNMWDYSDVGWQLVNETPEANRFRHFVALQMDEAVQYRCPAVLDEWLRPGTYTGGPIDLDDPMLVFPIPTFMQTS